MLTWDVIVHIAEFAPTADDYLAIASVSKEINRLLTENRGALPIFARNYISGDDDPHLLVPLWVLSSFGKSEPLTPIDILKKAIEFFDEGRCGSPRALRKLLRGRTTVKGIRAARILHKEIKKIKKKTELVCRDPPACLPDLVVFARRTFFLACDIAKVKDYDEYGRLGPKRFARARKIFLRRREVGEILEIARCLSWC